ncbi:MAG: TetR/AcrR family transcriptional regulator [Polyangiaceae bacterium]|nr:TetR/AcrR family transcriptional regulator [Polyangiaceae bacterium]
MARSSEATRHNILSCAIDHAAKVGLSGLTIGGLAEATHLSKSGLFAHFGSKEALQVSVIEAASERFVEEVVRPALKAPRGEPRVVQLFERWLSWALQQSAGCILTAASFELDDQPGPAREALVKSERDWLDTLAQAARIAQREGHFRADLDPEDFAFDLHGLMLSTHTAARLVRDPSAYDRAKRSFSRLLAASRIPPTP